MVCAFGISLLILHQYSFILQYLTTTYIYNRQVIDTFFISLWHQLHIVHNEHTFIELWDGIFFTCTGQDIYYKPHTLQCILG